MSRQCCYLGREAMENVRLKKTIFTELKNLYRRMRQKTLRSCLPGKKRTKKPKMKIVLYFAHYNEFFLSFSNGRLLRWALLRGIQYADIAPSSGLFQGLLEKHYQCLHSKRTRPKTSRSVLYRASPVTAHTGAQPAIPKRRAAGYNNSSCFLGEFALQNM